MIPLTLELFLERGFDLESFRSKIRGKSYNSKKKYGPMGL
jgi:hypothetical protein